MSSAVGGSGSAGLRREVSFERLELEGFGRHRQVTLEFPTGLALWIAGNEAGKSTAVLGLVATLWGVPHQQEPSGFTWGRFRHQAGGPHRGALTLRSGAARFRVERSFDSHRVRVLVEEPQGWRAVFEGEHNPNARREISPYLRWLHDHVGIDEARTVLDTFVVAQGDLNGDPHRVNDQTQALLVGAGGATARGAIEVLRNRVAALTRRRKALSDLFDRDGTKDQQLELAEQRVADLEADLREGAALADSLLERQRLAAEAGERERDAYAELDRLARSAAARGRWIAGRDEVVRSNRRWRDLTGAIEEARRLEVALGSERAATLEVHPELEGVDAEGFDDRIAEWLTAEGRVADQRQRVAELQQRHAAEREATERLLSEARRVEGEQVAAALAESDDESPPLGPQGEALAVLHGAARRFQAAVRSAAQARTALQQGRQTLHALAPFAALSEVERAELEGSSEAQRATAVRLEEAEEAYQRALRALQDGAARLASVAALDADAAAALRRFERALQEPDPAEPGRLIGAATMLGGGFAGAFLALAWPWWQAGALGVGLALVWALLWPRQPRLRRARRDLDRFAERFPALRGDDDQRSDLAKLRARYEWTAEARAEEEAEVAALKGRRDALAAEGEAFRARWAPLRTALQAALGAGAATGAASGGDLDLETALDRYRSAERQVGGAERQLAEAAAAVAATAGPDPLHPDAPAAAAGGDAQTLLAGLQLGDAREALSVGDLTERLAAIPESEWVERQLAARRSDRSAEARREVERLESEERREGEAHAALAGREVETLAQLEGALQAARAAALQGIPSAQQPASAQALRAAWAKRRVQLSRQTAAEEALRLHLRAMNAESIEALADHAANAQLAALEARRAWAAVVEEHPALPPAEVESEEAFERVSEAFERAEAEVERARGAAEDARRVASEATQALAQAQGSDPIDVAAVELELAEARAELQELTLERDASVLALDELSAASESTFEGTARTLEVGASERLRELSGVRGRRVVFDDAMRATVVDAAGERLSVSQLSQGARDQLALAIRFAFADLMADQVALPLLLDDPFLNWDDGRLAEAGAALRAAAANGRQIWVLSHRNEFLAWGEPVRVTLASG